MRDRALLEMIYACGMRVSEIINCKLESFDAMKHLIRVRGKGDKIPARSHRHVRFGTP